METDDVLTFSQNELPYNSFTVFEGMRENGQFCDLTIKVQNHCFTAHRIILAAGIPYFNSLYAKNAVDITEQEFTFTVADLEPRALESLIHFAYTGKVNITMENVNSLLVASQFLQMNQVLDACVEFISKRLSVDSVLKVRNFACSIDISKLVKNCELYIRKNFEEFSKCEDFLKLPHSCFKEIIADDDLIVSSEEAVFDAIMKWIKASPFEQRHVVLFELLNEVRLIYLSVDYFVDRVDCEKLISSSEACRNLVNEAKSYHLLPQRRSALSNLKMRPRTHFRQDLFAFCSCEECGYSVHHLVNETWHHWSSRKEEQYDTAICVVGVNDKIYIFTYEAIQTFCITTREWGKLTTKHTAIQGAAVVSKDARIYCFGSQEHSLTTRVRCFDTQINQWLEEIEMKTPRQHSAAASLEEWIYVTGGYDTANSCQINAVEKYNPSIGQWCDAAPMLTKRNRHGCTALMGKIYVCGGRNTDNSMMKTAEVYDPVTDQWNYIFSMAEAMDSFTLISYHNRIYALNEYNVEFYDPKCNEWKRCLYVPGGFKDAVLVPGFCVKNISD